MNFVSDHRTKEYGGLSSSNVPIHKEPIVNNTGEAEAEQRAVVVEWLNNILPNLSLPVKASEEDLRACLIDGRVLCQILNRLRPGSVNEGGDAVYSPQLRSENLIRFLAAMDEMGCPRFEISDLEKGYMKTVLECLLTLKVQFMKNVGVENISITGPGAKSGNSTSSHSTLTGEERRKVLSDSKFQRALRSPIMSEPSAALLHHVGHKFHEVFQLKQGRFADLPAAKISEMMKSNSLDNAPTQSLLSVVNGILDESIERKNGEIPHRVACLLRKVVQEIERRISTQAEHLRTQNNLFKTREEKYQSRIRVLEALATGSSEETQIVMSQLQRIKSESTKTEEENKVEEQGVERLMKEKDHYNLEISTLKQELEIAGKTHELRCLQMETKTKGAKSPGFLSSYWGCLGPIKRSERTKTEEKKKPEEQDMERLMKEKGHYNLEISKLKQELEIARKTHELRCLEIETETKGAKAGLEERLKELEHLLTDSRNKVKELEANSESKCQSWTTKEHSYQKLMDFQFGALRELRFTSESMKQEILKIQKSYSKEFNILGVKLEALADAAKTYHAVLAENRRMYNEVQDLKGNIRVYCRIRPFLPGQAGKQTTIEYIGENGELVVVNPSKQGKDGHRMFKFNKVFGPAATQAEVFLDTQPLIRSVLDGYNVCIFAYGQTGSGKTYTMTGPNGASQEDLGVNYRALNDLFQISQTRRSSFIYEVGVQMVEIYNEQVRDLLTSDGSHKKLGILTTSQPNGLAVPDASMHPVKSTSDVLELMDTGLKNRATGATAMNVRSSRSHSVVTIHVRGTDLKTGAALRGSLHLVDLAGSERVDRSEVAGDRLREAQHINKSLSALGDVIFALAQKSSHVPYRNSKLTQVLQSSLGGQAKTLMFVQLNPDVNSFSETMSTLKFAERVSGVELGAARSSKEGKDVKELMEQVASLKDTIAKKDEEIERLQLVKDLKNVYPGANGEKRGTGSLRYGSSSPSRNSIGGTPQRSQKPSGGKGFGLTEKAASDQDNCSDHSDKHSEAGSQQSMDDIKHQNEFLRQSKVAGGDIGQNLPEGAEILGFEGADYEERLSDISDGGLSMGTETDGSVDYMLSPEGSKSSPKAEKPKSTLKIPRRPSKDSLKVTTSPPSKDSLKVSTGMRKSGSTSLIKPPRRWQ